MMGQFIDMLDNWVETGRGAAADTLGLAELGDADKDGTMKTRASHFRK